MIAGFSIAEEHELLRHFVEREAGGRQGIGQFAKEPARGVLRGAAAVGGVAEGAAEGARVITYEWEGVPGVWTFEFWDKDRKLAAQSFTLARMTPAQQKNLGIPSCTPLVGSIKAPMAAKREIENPPFGLPAYSAALRPAPRPYRRSI